MIIYGTSYMIDLMLEILNHIVNISEVNQKNTHSSTGIMYQEQSRYCFITIARLFYLEYITIHWIRAILFNSGYL